VLSNYPPGVTESMLPDNRPCDKFQDDVLSLIAVDISALGSKHEGHILGLIDHGFATDESLARVVMRVDDYIREENLS